MPWVPRVRVPWVLWCQRIWWADLVCGSGGEQDGNSAAETIQLFFRVRESLSAGARSAGGSRTGRTGAGAACGGRLQSPPSPPMILAGPGQC